MCDPASRFAIELKKISGKRAKTEADYAEMARIEFLGGLYLSDGRPCLPGEVVEAALIAGAKKMKKGSQAKAGIVVPNPSPLIYNGPTDPNEMWADERFRLTVGVRIGQTRIMRTRPKFPEGWWAEIEILHLADIVDSKDIHEMLVTAGRVIGIGDWRPRFGRFEVV